MGRLVVAAAAGVALAASYAVLPMLAAAGTPSTAQPLAVTWHQNAVPTSSTPLTGAVVVGPGGATAGYDTKVVVITQGEPLEFVNLDEIAHTVTSVARKPDGSPLFTGNALPQSTSAVVGADKLAPGTYPFYCQFHPNMQGTLIVEGNGSKGVKPAAPRFLRPLRLPPVLHGRHITLHARQTAVRVLPHGPKTVMWTFNGSYPGPTIERPVGHLTKLTVVNDLPSDAGALTLHFHGDHHSAANDGQPDSHLIRAGRRHTYSFPLTDDGKPERAAFDFYHDHRMGRTGPDTWMGLQGMVITSSRRERRLGLPSGRYDVPLDVSDRSFDALNQLTNPFHHPGDGYDSLQDQFVGPFAPPGDATVGNDILVDGQLAPYLKVATHRYRLRLLNGANFATYDFHLSGGATFEQVGTGSALLPHPVDRSDILLGPAQRADVVVDFRHDLGKRITLSSIARQDSSIGGIGSTQGPVMQFRVTRRVADHSRVPRNLEPLPKLNVPATPTATWTFGLGGSLQRGTFWTVDNNPYDPHRIDLRVTLGSTQLWLLENLSPITHYIHIHEEQWRTIARDGRPPPAYEAGLQDTWRLDPGESVEVAAPITDYTGVFMIHCHMLDHEDHGMMAQFAVVKPGHDKLPAGFYLASANNSPGFRTAGPSGAPGGMGRGMGSGAMTSMHGMTGMTGMAGMTGMTGMTGMAGMTGVADSASSPGSSVLAGIARGAAALLVEGLTAGIGVAAWRRRTTVSEGMAR